MQRYAFNSFFTVAAFDFNMNNFSHAYQMRFDEEKNENERTKKMANMNGMVHDIIII